MAGLELEPILFGTILCTSFSIAFLFCHVYVCVVSLPVCMYAYGSLRFITGVCVYAYIQKPKVYNRCHPKSLSTLYFEAIWNQNSFQVVWLASLLMESSFSGALALLEFGESKLWLYVVAVPTEPLLSPTLPPFQVATLLDYSMYSYECVYQNILFRFVLCEWDNNLYIFQQHAFIHLEYSFETHLYWFIYI